MLGYWIGFVMALSAPVYSVSLGGGPNPRSRALLNSP